MSFDLYTYSELRNESLRRQVRCYPNEGIKLNNHYLFDINLNEIQYSFFTHNSDIIIESFGIIPLENDMVTFYIQLRCIINNKEFPISMRQDVFLKNYQLLKSA